MACTRRQEADSAGSHWSLALVKGSLRTAFRRTPTVEVAAGHRQAISLFKDDGTRDIYDGQATKKARARLPEKLWRLARKKMDYVLAAQVVEDLRLPPSNHLEALAGDLSGHFSVRIND